MQREAGGELLIGIAAGDALPSQCSITGVRAFVQPGTARASSSDRVRLRAYQQAASGLGLTAIGSDVRDDGTTNLQTLDVGAFTPFTLSNDRSDTYGHTNLGLVVRIDAGVTAGVDRAYLVEVRYEVAIR
jgi:hypothetical protein